MAVRKLPRLPDGNAVIDGNSWNQVIAPAIERNSLNSVWGGQLKNDASGQSLVILPSFTNHFVKLGASTSNGPNKWLYAFTEVVPCSTSTSPSGWTNKSGGLTDVTYGAKAQNGLEANNTSGGTQGCGININNLTGNFALVPIGVNAIVQLFLLTNSDDGSPAPWFFAPNQPDGSCTGISSGTGTGS